MQVKHDQTELLDKLSQPTRTRETVAEYAAFSKADRDRAKDIGGFVGGYLKNGKRKKPPSLEYPNSN
ncbi:MAG: hypothetical protein Q4D04_15365 [Clostridia bacterium]|nr:hypothetical protein [Clostridia bacterium]